MSQEQEEKHVDRYLLFVGCDLSDCEAEHNHHKGWDCLAAASDDLDAIRRECLKIPEHLWWQVVDLANMRVCMRSLYRDAPQH